MTIVTITVCDDFIFQCANVELQNISVLFILHTDFTSTSLSTWSCSYEIQFCRKETVSCVQLLQSYTTSSTMYRRKKPLYHYTLYGLPLIIKCSFILSFAYIRFGVYLNGLPAIVWYWMCTSVLWSSST